MKKILINGCFHKLISLSKNYTQYPRNESVLSTSSITDSITDSITNETASSITDSNEAVSEPVEDTAKTGQP